MRERKWRKEKEKESKKEERQIKSEEWEWFYVTFCRKLVLKRSRENKVNTKWTARQHLKAIKRKRLILKNLNAVRNQNTLDIIRCTSYEFNVIKSILHLFILENDVESIAEQSEHSESPADKSAHGRDKLVPMFTLLFNQHCHGR